MKLLLLLMTFTISLQAKNVFFAQSKMPAKWHKLNNLIEEETKTIQALGKNLGPRLTHRMIELKTEKVKLLKEWENKNFFAAPPAARKKLGKKSFFKESTRLAVKVRRMAKKILKEYPAYRAKSEVYYTLALNERDYNRNKYTEYYLHKSLKFSKGNNYIRHHAFTALAEYYYNKKKYNKCIKYYNQSLKNKNDEWLTKHMYNQGWCYVKKQKYNLAINNLKEAYELGNQDKYIDISNQILEAISTFFILDGSIMEGRDFLVSTKDPLPYLHTYVKKLADKGKFKEAEIVTNDFMDIANSKGEVALISKFYLTRFDIYRNFKKYNKFFSAAKEFETLVLDNKDVEKEDKKKKIDKEIVSAGEEKIKGLAGYQQIQLSKKSYMLENDKKMALLNQIVAYFDITSNINEKERPKYTYFQGETYYSIALDSAASKKYMSSLALLEKSKTHNEFKKKNIDALLSVLERGNLKKSEVFPTTEFTYKKHLEYWPVNERSRQIYGRLFNLYLNKGDTENSHATLALYQKNYKKDGEKQRAMLTRIMDLYIKRKDTDSIALWVGKLEDGHLSFKKEYIKKAVKILGQLLFDDLQKEHVAKNFDKAIEGYQALFNNEKYPRSIKAEAALSTSIIYLDKLDTSASLEWMMTAIPLLSTEKFNKYLSKIDGIAEEYLLLQDYKGARKLSETMSDKLCSGKKTNFKDSFYKRELTSALLTNDFSFKIFKRVEKCALPAKVATTWKKKFFLSELNFSGYDKFIDIYEKYEKYPSFKKTLDEQVMANYWKADHAGDKSEKRSFESFFKKLLRKNKNYMHAASIKVIFDNEKYVESLYDWSEDVELPNELNSDEQFDQDKFNAYLEKSLAEIQTLTNKAKPFLNSGEQDIIIKTYIALNHSYMTLATAIDSFTPQGAPAEFVTQFKGFMKGISKNLYKKVNSHKWQVKKLVRNGKINSPHSIKLTSSNEAISNINHRFPASFLVIPADQKGDL